MSKTLHWIAAFLAAHPILDDVLAVAAWSAGAALAADVLLPIVTVIKLPPEYAFAGPILNSAAYGLVRILQDRAAAARAKAAADAAAGAGTQQETKAP